MMEEEKKNPIKIIFDGFIKRYYGTIRMNIKNEEEIMFVKDDK